MPVPIAQPVWLKNTATGQHNDALNISQKFSRKKGSLLGSLGIESVRLVSRRAALLRLRVRG